VVAVSDRNTATQSQKNQEKWFFCSFGVFICSAESVLKAKILKEKKRNCTLTPCGCLLIFLEENPKKFIFKKQL
jgi:hypothetical protein